MEVQRHDELGNAAVGRLVDPDGGLHPLVQLAFLNLRLLSARLAIAAGVLILLNR